MTRRFLAVIGDANDPRTWSGIPFHFLQAGRRAGLLDEGLALPAEGLSWRLRRWSWNAARPLAGERLGGYQYTERFLERLWADARERVQGQWVVSCFQLLPPSVAGNPGVETWFFVDQTLRQLFEEYGQQRVVGRKVARDAVTREAEGYRAAAGVVAHSRWAARSMIEAYGVPPERVHVVLPGPSLDIEAYERWEAAEELRRADPVAEDGDAGVRLVFVGKEWHRKGLDRLILGFERARGFGFRGTLRVIGCPREGVPRHLRSIRGVEWTGFVDKRRDAARFLDLVGSADVGCLLSRAEAGGIALREYAAAGLAVLTTDAGGAPEHAPPDTSVVLGALCGTEEIAEALMAWSRDPDRLRGLKREAWERRHEVSWSASVRRLAVIMGARIEETPNERQSVG